MKSDKERVARILDRLDEHYPRRESFLEYTQPWQLLVATILSAQCTDARVNIVTKDLFVRYPDIPSLAEADISELEGVIRSVGFFHNKAANIKACAQELVKRFDSKVPHTIEELTSLPGVGRKTANVVRCHIFKEPAIVVDTHVKRISLRLGLTDTDDPVRAEFELMDVLPREHWSRYNIQLMSLGREICTGQRPKCAGCFLRDDCKYNG